MSDVSISHETSKALVEVSLFLLARRFRARGVGNDEVATMVVTQRHVLGNLSMRELARRYLVELTPEEITGPH